MAQQNEDHQELMFKYHMATVKPELETCQNAKINSYVTCHVKCIDGEHGELLQLSAVSRDKTFNRYVKHKGQISAKVAQQTGLEIRSGKLYRSEKVLKVKSVKSTIRQFLDWLKSFVPPLLLIGSCDWYPLLREIQAQQLVPDFEIIVVGLCDARDLFKDGKSKKKLSSQELCTRLLEGCNNSDKSGDVVDYRDGLNWVKLLQSMLDKKANTGGVEETLCHINRISYNFKSSILHTEYITAGERNFEFEWHNRSLKNAAFNNHIAKQIAYSGLNFKDIWLMYKKWGMEGIQRCFTSKVKKKFRVTNNERSICSVIGYLASQNNLDKHVEYDTLGHTSVLPNTTQTLLTEAQLQNPVATLDVKGDIHKIYPGENKIGRNPSTCTVLIQSQGVCLEHAILKVTGDSHFITHLGGPNDLWVGKVKLKEKTPYPLRGGECLKFGDICAKYIICTRGEHDMTCSAIQSLLTNEVLCLCPFLHNIENPAELLSTQIDSSEYEGWQTNLKYILERINIFISTYPKNHLPYVAVACDENGGTILPHEALGGGLHWSANLIASFSLDDNRSVMEGFRTWLQEGFSNGVPVLVVAHNEHLTQLQASLTTSAHVIHHAIATRFIQYLISKSTGRDIGIARNKERNAIGWVVYMQNLLSSIYMELRRALDDCQAGLLRDILELLAKVMDKLGFGGVLYLLTILYDQPHTKTIIKSSNNSSHTILCDIKKEKIDNSEISVICIDDDSDEDMNSLPDITPKKEPFKSNLKFDDNDDICIVEECKKEDSSLCITLDSESDDDTENISRNYEKPKINESLNKERIMDYSIENQNLENRRKNSGQRLHESISKTDPFKLNIERRVDGLFDTPKSASKISEEMSNESGKYFLTEEELFGFSSEEKDLYEEQSLRKNIEENSSDSDEPYGKHLKKTSKTLVTEEDLFGSNARKGKIMVTVEDLFGSEARKENSKEKVIVTEELFGKSTGQKLFGSFTPKLCKQRRSKLDQEEICVNTNDYDINKPKMRKEENIKIVTEDELFGQNANTMENRNEKNLKSKNLNKHHKLGRNQERLKFYGDNNLKKTANYQEIELQEEKLRSYQGKYNETSSETSVRSKEEKKEILQNERRHTEIVTVEDLFETSVDEDDNVKFVTEEDLFGIDIKESKKEPSDKKLCKDFGTGKTKKEGRNMQLVTEKELFGRNIKECEVEPKKKKLKIDSNMQVLPKGKPLHGKKSKIESLNKKNKEPGTEKTKKDVTIIERVTEELLFGCDSSDSETKSKSIKLNKEYATEKAKQNRLFDLGDKGTYHDKLEVNGRKPHSSTDKNEISKKMFKYLGVTEKKNEKSSKEENQKINIFSKKIIGSRPLSNYKDDSLNITTVDIKGKSANKNKLKIKSWNITDVSEINRRNKLTDVYKEAETKNRSKTKEKTESNKNTKISDKAEDNNCIGVSEKSETKDTKIPELPKRSKCTTLLNKTESNKCSNALDKTKTNKCTKLLENSSANRYQELKQNTEKNKLPDIDKTTSKFKTKVRPFNLLMQDVIFRVKGFLQPDFEKIRNRMESMGARFVGRKDQIDATHIICASKPLYLKYLSKRNKMKIMRIVTADWVHEAFCNKRRYPWRQFTFKSCAESIALSIQRMRHYTRDNSTENSEDEIWAEGDEIWAEELAGESELHNPNWRKFKESVRELPCMSKASNPIKEIEPEDGQSLIENTSSSIENGAKPGTPKTLHCGKKVMQLEISHNKEKLDHEIKPDQNQHLYGTGAQEPVVFGVQSKKDSGDIELLCKDNKEDAVTTSSNCGDATPTENVSLKNNEFLYSGRLMICIRSLYLFSRNQRAKLKKRNPNLVQRDLNKMVGEWMSNVHFPPSLKGKFKENELCFARWYLMKLLRERPNNFCWKNPSKAISKDHFRRIFPLKCMSAADALTKVNLETTSSSMASLKAMDSTTNKNINEYTSEACEDLLKTTNTASHALYNVTSTKLPKNTQSIDNHHSSSVFTIPDLSTKTQENNCQQLPKIAAKNQPSRQKPHLEEDSHEGMDCMPGPDDAQPPGGVGGTGRDGQISMGGAPGNGPPMKDASGSVTHRGQGSVETDAIQVPDKMVGLIIGRGGYQKDMLQKVSGAKIKIAGEKGGLPDRECTISGARDAIDQAKKMIFHIVSHGDSHSDWHPGDEITCQGIRSPVQEKPRMEFPIDSPVQEILRKESSVGSPVQEKHGMECQIGSPVQEKHGMECQIGSPVQENLRKESSIGSPIQENPRMESTMESLVQENPRMESPMESSVQEDISCEGGSEVSIMIPGHKVGLIIGKGGRTIRELQEISGAKMKIIQDGPQQQKEKPLRIAGEPYQVKIAKQLAYHLLAEKESQEAQSDNNSCQGGVGYAPGDRRDGDRDKEQFGEDKQEIVVKDGENQSEESGKKEYALKNLADPVVHIQCQSLPLEDVKVNIEPVVEAEEYEKKESVQTKLVDQLPNIDCSTAPLSNIKFDDAPSPPKRSTYHLFMQEFKKDAGANFTLATARESWKKMSNETKKVYALRLKMLKKQSKRLFLSYVKSLESQQQKVFVGIKRAKLLSYFQEDIFAEEYPAADYPVLLLPKKVKPVQIVKDTESLNETDKDDKEIPKIPQIKVKSFDQLTEKGIVPLDSDFHHYEGLGVGSLSVSSSDKSVNWTCPTTVTEYNDAPYEEDSEYSDSDEWQMDFTEIDLTNECSNNETLWNECLLNEIHDVEMHEFHDNRNPSSHNTGYNSGQENNGTVISSPIVRGKVRKTKENPKSLKKSIKELRKYVSRTKCQENWQPEFQEQNMGTEQFDLMKQLNLVTPADNSSENIEEESLIYLMTHEVSSDTPGNSNLACTTPYDDSSEMTEKESDLNLLTSHDDVSEKSEKEREPDLITSKGIVKSAKRSEIYEEFTEERNTNTSHKNVLEITKHCEENLGTSCEMDFDFEGFTEKDIENGKFER